MVSAPDQSQGPSTRLQAFLCTESFNVTVTSSHYDLNNVENMKPSSAVLYLSRMTIR